MKVHLAAALLLTSVLAGCSSGGDDAADLAGALGAPTLYLNVTVGDQTYRFSSGGSSAATSSSAASATVSATATATSGTAASGNATKGNGTKAAASGNQTASGEAPLNVSVTLGAKGLPVDNAFTWTLDWGDGQAAGTAAGNGTATSSTASATGASTTGGAAAKANATKAGGESGSKVPATVKHTYTAPGNHTIRFTLTPANGTAASVSTTIAVAAPSNATGNQTAFAPGTVLGTLMLDQEGTFTAAVQGLDCSSAQGVDQDASFPWEFPAADSNGTAAAVGHVLLTLSQGSSTLDASLHFIGPDGSTIESADAQSVDGDPIETLDLEGPFEPGAYTVKVVGCAAVGGGFTVHGEATLVAA